MESSIREQFSSPRPPRPELASFQSGPSGGHNISEQTTITGGGRMPRAQSFSSGEEESVRVEDRGWTSFRGQRRGGAFTVLDEPGPNSPSFRSPVVPRQMSTIDFLQTIQVRRTPGHEEEDSPLYTASPLVERSPRPSLKRLNSKSQVTQLQEHALPALSLGENRRTKKKGEKGRKVKITTRREPPALPTPLYEAVSSGASRDVIESIVKDDPSQTSRQNEGGFTPLHCAVEHYDTPIDRIMLLLEADPKSAGIRSNNGQTPVDLIWKRFVDPEPFRSEETRERAASLRRLLEEAVGPLESQQMSGGHDSKPSPSVVGRRRRAKQMLQEHASLRHFWETITIFIQSASHGSARSMHRQSGRRNRIIHDAVKLKCDPLLVRFAIARYPEQMHKLDDCLQRLPLHVAAAGGPSSDNLFRTLLVVHPEAASAVDATGRLPLHIAIASGVSWEGGLEALLSACPRSLLTPDPLTGLLPFQLAASLAGEENLTTVYKLLQSEPTESLQGGL